MFDALEIVFLGEFEIAIDEKNRIVIPSKWRDDLGKNIVLTDGFEGAVEIRTKTSFIKYCKNNLIEEDSYLREIRTIRRKILGGAYEVSLDKWFRFVIPSKFNKGFRGTVLLRGNGDFIELWCKEEYEAWAKDEKNTIEKAAEAISAR